MAYTTNSTEDYIHKLYRVIGILHPHQLNIDKIAAKLEIGIFYSPVESMNIGNAIILDNRVSRKKQWQDFGHELCHVLWHAGNQIIMPMPYQVYQENKSNNFARHLCIPTFMLEQIQFTEYDRDHVWRIEEIFNVEKNFAEKRWEQYVRNLIYS